MKSCTARFHYSLPTFKLTYFHHLPLQFPSYIAMVEVHHIIIQVSWNSTSLIKKSFKNSSQSSSFRFPENKRKPVCTTVTTACSEDSLPSPSPTPEPYGDSPPSPPPTSACSEPNGDSPPSPPPTSAWSEPNEDSPPSAPATFACSEPDVDQPGSFSAS